MFKQPQGAALRRGQAAALGVTAITMEEPFAAADPFLRIGLLFDATFP